MLKHFTTKELIFIALMSALLIVVNLVFGVVLETISIEAAEFITGLTNTIFIAFVALTFKRLGALSLFYLIYSLLTLPFPLGGGPPGFFLKIPLLVIPIIFFDLILYFTNFQKSGFIIGLPIFIIILALTHLAIFYLLNMPQFNMLLKAIWILVIGLIVLGYVGISLGFTLYNKLKNKRIIQQITN